MFEDASKSIELIDQSCRGLSRAETISKLRKLSISDFGALLFSLPNDSYPNLSLVLPRMASDEVQVTWTGTNGHTLLKQTIDAARILAYNYTNLKSCGLKGESILDFGCGYGRLIRLMYYFSDESDVFGVDPWLESIQVCAEAGITANIFQSEYLPNNLPMLNDRKFDLAFAFSVFTHLSIRATSTSLLTLREQIKDDGVIAITFRPIEYWDMHFVNGDQNECERLKSCHRSDGFAFLPHNRSPVDGDITYGDTSFSLEWLSNSNLGLKVLSVDRSLSDPYQCYAFLGKA